MNLTMKLAKTIIILIFLIPIKVISQVTLVKDINKAAHSSFPKEITQIGSIVYFISTSLSREIELWRSDGTAAGTVKVKDIYPSSGPSGPLYLTNVNGVLYFRADSRSILKVSIQVYLSMR